MPCSFPIADAPTISCENQFFYVPRLVNAPSSVLSPARAVASCGLQSGTLPLVSSRPCIRIYRTRLRSYFNTDIQEGFYRRSSIANSAVVLASGAAVMESNRLPVFCVCKYMLLLLLLLLLQLLQLLQLLILIIIMQVFCLFSPSFRHQARPMVLVPIIGLSSFACLRAWVCACVGVYMRLVILFLQPQTLVAL